MVSLQGTGLVFKIGNFKFIIIKYKDPTGYEPQPPVPIALATGPGPVVKQT